MTRPSDRDGIFQAIRRALANLPERTPLPDYDEALPIAWNRLSEGDLWQAFARNFQAVHGRLLHSVDALKVFLREGGYREGYCDPALRGVVGEPLVAAGLTVHFEYRREDCERYAFGITRATAAVAETGSLVLDDEHTADRLAALSPWVHVGVLHPTEIHRSVGEALAALGDSVNTIWCTGPSKTADIEGILIKGVHGPGEEICLSLEAVPALDSRR